MSFKFQDDCRICEEHIWREAEEKLIEIILKNILHEIRNPLVQIGGLVSSLSKIFENLGDSEDIVVSRDRLNKIKYYETIIKREMKGLEEILCATDDFFTHKNLELQKIDLNKIVGEAIEMVDYGEADKIEIRPSLNLQRKATVDPIKIKMLVLNLLINAKEAIFESDMTGKKPLIDVITGSTGDSIVFFEVKNNGKPILNEHLKKIFNLFFTTKGNGRGRGLTVVNAIVRAHKGDIEAKNLDDGKISFKVFLPYA